MPTVNMHEAKTRLSKLVADVETGIEREVIIARNGKPVARLVPIGELRKKNRLLGIAEGKFGNLDEEWFKQWQALDAVIWNGVLDEPIDPADRDADVESKKSA
jgi:prevent-host-death family protein